MNKHDFNQLVDLALRNQDFATMRPVVEKELLHHEIFQALDAAGLLKHLVFQGGTSLRLCRGSDRFSEDFNFAGGRDFTPERTHRVKACIETHIGRRFGLNLAVKEPKASDAAARVAAAVTFDTWWISIETAPGNAAMPRQRIKLEIANVSAYASETVPLLPNYEFFAGMKQVLVNAESVSEILAHKIVAFPASLIDHQGAALPASARKIRHRDIWDIAWLIGKKASLNPSMALDKINDYRVSNYAQLLDRAIALLAPIVKGQEFKNQMRRFIDAATLKKTLDNDGWLDYLISTAGGQLADMRDHLPR